ncbi:MAG: ISAs1 family transposase [Candidatus Omnitrophica bacterium]|nr:ISAs1 family transposase [Candidatus Omnitrophota bacterium]
MPKQEIVPEAEVLRRITVRLILPQERDSYDQLLQAQHYLHSARLGGQSLRYVAELDGQWVALIAFSAPALNIKARERWIGWTPRRRTRRLCFVVNNSRFLVLPDRQRYPNLASRVLSLCLKRLSQDWQEQWGHPVLLVESFVDETQYRGTAYRACGFEAVGCSSGYGRSSRDFYLDHGQPKQLYLRELCAGAAATLRRPRLPAQLAPHEESLSGPCPLRAPSLDSLLEVFRSLGDSRRGHGLRHPQPFVLACATVAMLLGAGGYQAFEDVCSKLTQRQLRALGCRLTPKTNRYVPPSDSTFFRVLNSLDPHAFDLAVGRWMMEQDISVLEGLAVDGKVLRGSGRGDGQALQLLSAVSHRLRLTVAQEPIEQKSNEIPALQPLLKQLPAVALAGSVITADALHCQQQSARFVTQELGADYLFGLKGNQSGILERAQVKLPQPFFFRRI